MINITTVRSISTRLVLATLALGLAAGCEAAVITPPGLPPPGTDGGAGNDPRAFFDANVAPVLAARCRSCHELDEPAFLLADSYYESVRAYSPSLIVPGEPDMSYILTHPASASHTGTDFATQDEKDVVAEWIVLEGMYGTDLDGGMGGFPLTTTPVPINPIGPNSIRLESVGLPGSRVEFDASSSGTGSGIRVENITFYAGGAGLAVSGARFVLVHQDTGVETVMAGTFTDGPVRLNGGMSLTSTATPVLDAYTSEMLVAIRFDSAGTLSP